MTELFTTKMAHTTATLASIFTTALFTMTLVVAQQNPSISSISQEKIVDIGDTTDLSCSVQYARGYPVIWAKIDNENPSNNLFISRGSSLSLPDNRYSIRHDEASSTYTLQLSKIQEVDSGLYQCQVVIGTRSRVTADVRVIVNIPPVISDNSTRSVITSAGETIALHCYASGHPTPQVSWRRENNNLLPTGGAVYKGNDLLIHNISKNDRGTYYCIADNGVGKGARRNVGVEVEFQPEVKINKMRVEQALHYDADIACRIEAFPSPIVEWWKDGYQINDNQNFHISVFSSAHEITDSILRISRIKKNNFGKYTCKARNKLGHDEKDVELRESINPVCPPACSVSINGAPLQMHLSQATALVVPFAMSILSLTLAKLFH